MSGHDFRILGASAPGASSYLSLRAIWASFEGIVPVYLFAFPKVVQRENPFLWCFRFLPAAATGAKAAHELDCNQGRRQA